MVLGLAKKIVTALKDMPQALSRWMYGLSRMLYPSSQVFDSFGIKKVSSFLSGSYPAILSVHKDEELRRSGARIRLDLSRSHAPPKKRETERAGGLEGRRKKGREREMEGKKNIEAGDASSIWGSSRDPADWK